MWRLGYCDLWSGAVYEDSYENERGIREAENLLCVLEPYKVIYRYYLPYGDDIYFKRHARRNVYENNC